MPLMHAPRTTLGRGALALAVALFTVGCGEVTGPAESPKPSRPPQDDADLDAMTDDDFGNDDQSADVGDDQADQGGADSGGGDEKAYSGVGEPTEGDTRDLSVIADMVKQRRQPVRACYEQARKKKPELQGRMVIHFEVDPEGKVTSAELNAERSQITEPDLVECAVKVIKGIKFPASSKGMITEVNYPYKFKP